MTLSEEQKIERVWDAISRHASPRDQAIAAIAEMKAIEAEEAHIALLLHKRRCDLPTGV
jgi:hypothetical protein